MLKHEKITLIGAGSAMFTRGLVADLIDRGWEADLALVDIDPGALETAERLTAKMIAARKASIKLSASTNRRDVLKSTTAVITTIGVGGRRAWEQDVFIPRKHGIFMPVGDTVGPGGSSRALRMIPPMIAIAEDILDLAPQALFFNYGNPMAPVCRAVRKATGAQVVGLCHGVIHVARYLADVLGVPLSRMNYTASGINHLTWFTHVRVDGVDVMPQLLDIARTRLADNSSGGNPDANRFSWELMQLFNAFPAVLDRHVCEFFPQFFREGTYYGQKLGVDAFSFEDTIAYGDQIFEEMRQDAFSAIPLDEAYFARISGEHEQVLDIIDSIRNDRNVIYSANLPNHGQINNLPSDAIVETPVIANASGMHPIMQPRLSVGIAGTLATRFQWVETIVEAALERSRRKFIQALVIDGACASMEQAQAVGEDLLNAQKAFLTWV